MFKKNIVGKNKKFKLLIFSLIIVFLNVLTFGKALFFNFIDEDWVALWLSKYNFQEYKNYMAGLWHPGQIFNTYPWVFVFGNSPQLWQVLGLLLKIFASFSLGLALYGVTGLIESFYLGSLLYSVNASGIETFAWASGRISAYLIILFNLAIYFYFASLAKDKLIKFLISLIFTGIALLLDPYRAVPFVAFLIFWEFVTRIIKKDLLTKNYLIRVVFLCVVSVILLSKTQVGESLLLQKPGSSNGYLMTIKASVGVYTKFVASIGTPFAYLVNPLKPYYRSGEVTTDSLYLGYIFFPILLLSLIYFIKKRSTMWLNIFMCLLWIPLFYFPNWMADLNWSSNIYHRFLAIPGEGLVMVICLLLLYIPKPKNLSKYLLIAVFLLSNIMVSMRIVNSEYKVRGLEYTSPILTKIKNDIPKNIGRAGLWFQSDNNGISTYFGSGGSISPYVSMIIGAKNLDDVVIIQDAQKLICDKNVNRPLFFGWSVQKDPLPIENVFAWTVNYDYSIENITDSIRPFIASSAPCYENIVDESIGNNLVLVSYSYLDHLFDTNKEVISLNFQVTTPNFDKTTIQTELYTKNMALIDKQNINLDISKIHFVNVYFLKSSTPPYYLILSVNSEKNNYKKTIILKSPGRNL